MKIRAPVPPLEGDKGGREIEQPAKIWHYLFMHEEYNYYNKRFKPLARKLRSNSTQAEVRLWCELLRANKMTVKFNRQRPIGNYIADFFCKELKLIIEVDGLSHHNEKVALRDFEREDELKALGFTILRFTDEEVMRDIDNVHRAIETTIFNLRANFSSPLAPSKGGR